MAGTPPAGMAQEGGLTAQQKKDLLNRLARIEGQLRGVQKLVVLAETPSDCDAVAQQMAAARKALDRSFVQLLSASLRTQSGNATDMDEARATAERLATLLDKFA
jgi:CsoR family transcriptional regulator, copper-sensing transcriptional repressor